MSRRLVVLGIAAILLAGVGASATTLSRTYRWESLGRSWSVSLSFSSTQYDVFRSLPRALDFHQYGSYVADPRADEEMERVSHALGDLAASASLNVWERLNLVVSFIQSLQYTKEQGEYPKYPVETLVEGAGDCEDFAILTADLLQRFGFGVILLAYTVEGHMAVGLRVLPLDTKDCQAYAWNGDIYYYLETTTPGWEIGHKPEIYASEPEIIEILPTFALR